MPLEKSCLDQVGHLLLVCPVEGYGWQRYDSGYTSTTPPSPFKVRLKELIFEADEIAGGFSVMEEPGHELDTFWVVFFARPDDIRVNFTTAIGSYNVIISPDRPLIKLKPGLDAKHPQSTSASGVPRLRGYADIGISKEVVDRMPSNFKDRYLGMSVEEVYRSLEAKEESLGSDHPEVGRTLDHLGFMLAHEKRFTEAEPLIRKALKVWEKIYGSTDIVTGRTLECLANVLFDTGRKDEAEPFFRRALTISNESFGPKKPEMICTLQRLLKIYNDSGQWVELKDVLQQLLSIREKQLPADDPMIEQLKANVQAMDKSGARDCLLEDKPSLLEQVEGI